MTEATGLASYLQRRHEGTRYVFAPFIQAGALEVLLGNSKAPTIIVTRWNPDDLRSGVSDVDVFPLARIHGWTVMLHARLHLKAYSWNINEAVVGSANVTNRALGIQAPSNEEILVGPIKLPPGRVLQLRRIAAEANLVTAETYEAALGWIASQPPIPPHATMHEFPTIDRQFLTSVLPMSATPKAMTAALESFGTQAWDTLDDEVQECALHDAANLGLDPDLVMNARLPMDVVRDAFFKGGFIRAIEAKLDPCIHFGELKAWIQARCTDVPVPSRRDLTSKVQVLLRWFTELAPERYEVTVPMRHSERLCRKQVRSDP